MEHILPERGGEDYDGPAAWAQVPRASAFTSSHVRGPLSEHTCAPAGEVKCAHSCEVRLGNLDYAKIDMMKTGAPAWVEVGGAARLGGLETS